MGNRIVKFLLKHSGALTALALLIGISSVNSACYMMYHQPKMPKALDDYRM